MCNCGTLQTAYNNATQDFTATGTQIAVLGNLAASCGCAVGTLPNGFKIRDNGKYRISYDITATATTAGVLTVQLYADGMALPCASAAATVTADDVVTIHVETAIPLCGCTVIYGMVGGVTGAVNHVCASVGTA